MIRIIETILVLLLVTLNILPTCAQQFRGSFINTSLPFVPGSEVTYWNILDANNKNTTLINYSSLSSSNTRLTPSKTKRVVIFIHGLDRDPGTYISNMLTALAGLSGNSSAVGVNTDTVQIVCPYFTNGDDKGVGYPFNTSAPAGGSGSYTNVLVWPGSQWIGGGLNEYPYKQKTVSNYAVLDQMIQYFDNKALFPNVNQIVVAGHSAGAQTVQRYAEVGNVLKITTPLSYWVANPNSYSWLSTSRPLDYSTCSVYDVWPQGLTNYTSPYTYASALVAQGRPAVLARYNSRKIAYARGLLDDGDDSSNCAPLSQGANRNERFLYFIQDFPPVCNGFSTCSTVDYVDVGHDGGGMMASASGSARLFLDNFNGTQNMAFDVGCPRQLVGDNPYPDPTCNTTATFSDTFLTYNGMGYQGCFSDSSIRTLSYQAYVSSGNTVEMCTAACVTAGYTIAGVEFADECYCGNVLGYTATGPLLDNACTMACAGNASEICGGPNRINLFSGSVPTIAPAPYSPPVVGPFTYQGCYTETTSGRALPQNSRTTSDMTIDKCASFCSSYNAFGVEYADECYCGTILQPGSSKAASTDCDMVCAGNSTEFCGGPSRMNLYAQNATLLTVSGPPPTSASSSTSITSAITVTTATTVPATLTSTSATPTATLSCPASDAMQYTTSNNDTFVVECYNDRAGGDAGMVHASSFEACLNACANLSGCTDVSYLPGPPGPCYMKTSVVAGSKNNGVWGAIALAALPTQSTSSSSLTATSTTSASSPTATTTTTTSSAAPASSTLSCPSSDGTQFITTNNETFVVQCYIDHNGGDVSMVHTTSLDACLNACSNYTGCTDVAWVPGNPGPCYMKDTVVPGVSNNGVWGAAIVGAGGVSSSSSATSTLTTSTTPPSTTASPTSTPTPTLFCPNSNGTTYRTGNEIFLIQCYIDHNGGDATMVYTKSLDLCLAACAGYSGCTDVAWVPGSPGPCYMKTKLVPGSPNSGVWGAVVVGTASSTVVTAISSVMTMSSTVVTTSSSVTPTSATTASVIAARRWFW